MSAAGIPWPGGLPFTPTRQGYRRSREDDKARFKPELGDAKTRPRHTAQASLHSVTIPNLTRDQLADLHEFYTETLRQGSLPVLWPEDPVVGGAADFKFETTIDDVPSGAIGADGNDMWNASFVLRRLP